MSEVKLRTYMVWRDGKYKGLMTSLLLLYELRASLKNQDYIADIGRLDVNGHAWTWSRITDPDRMITFGKLW